MRAVEGERVEQRHDVGEQLVACVAPTQGGTPTGSTQVGTDHPELLGQPGNDFAPLPPVLGEAVQQQHGYAAARLGHVHAQPRELHEVMIDSLELRQLGLAHGATILPSQCCVITL